MNRPFKNDIFKNSRLDDAKEEIENLIDYDPANELTHLTFIERINKKDLYNVKDYINANINDFLYPESLKKFIQNLLSKENSYSDDIINEVTYSTFHPIMSGIEIPGRIKCSNNSVFTLQRLIRNSLINNNYIDIDMKNAHLSILSNILNIYLPDYKNNENFKYIDELIYNRDALIRKMQYLFMHEDYKDLSKLECKNFIFGNMYSYQQFDQIINKNYNNKKIISLIQHTLYNDKYFTIFPRFFINWFVKNDFTLNINHIDDNDYNKNMYDFIDLCNKISNNIRNIQIFITLLHEYGVKKTNQNKNYSIGKKFTEESHSYINIDSIKNKQFKYYDEDYKLDDNIFTTNDEIRVVPNVIPPSTTQNLYFYLYNTSLRQQLKQYCFKYNVDNTVTDDISAADKVFYNTALLENCYMNFNVIFRMIMNEYEKTLLWHCIKYTMDKLNLKNNLHAILCHDGFMLDREYFNEGTLNYDTYLCDLKNYIEQETGFNINFEYKDHCNEIIETINCVNDEDKIYSCADQSNYKKIYNEKMIYSPKTKKQIAKLTENWNKNNPDEITEENGQKRPLYKLYYDDKNNKYYHFIHNKPEPLPKDKSLKLFQ